MTKPWAARLQQHVDDWSARLASRSSWPKFAYHFTGIENAASILGTGVLYSRNEARRRGLMVQDNAAPSVIAGTNPARLEYARLYFRPRTPTQYRNEGFLPAAQRGLKAHCAVPVFFVFDFVSVASLDVSLFSDGNLGSSSAALGGDEAFFSALPFADIYSDGGMQQRTHDLTHRRNAEIVVPDALPLEPHLKAVVCRSTAERQTLLHLLDPAERARWGPTIRIARDTQLFERRGVYVESVTAYADESVMFLFNPAARERGPFKLEGTFTAPGVPIRRFGSDEWTQRDAYVVQFRGVQDLTGELELRLDGEVAFCGQVSFEPLPF